MLIMQHKNGYMKYFTAKMFNRHLSHLKSHWYLVYQNIIAWHLMWNYQIILISIQKLANYSK